MREKLTWLFLALSALGCSETNNCGAADCSDVVVVEFDRALPAASYRVTALGECSFEEPDGDATCVQMSFSRDDLGRLRLVSPGAPTKLTVVLEANGAEVLRQEFRPVYEDYTVECLGTCKRAVVTVQVADFTVPPLSPSDGGSSGGGGQAGHVGSEAGAGGAGGVADPGSAGASGECLADAWQGHYYRTLEPLSTTCPYVHEEPVTLENGREVYGTCVYSSEKWSDRCEYSALLSCSGSSAWTLAIVVADEQGDGRVLAGTAHLEATADGSPCAGDYKLTYERTTP